MRIVDRQAGFRSLKCFSEIHLRPTLNRPRLLTTLSRPLAGFWGGEGEGGERENANSMRTGDGEWDPTESGGKAAPQVTSVDLTSV